ncbi:N-acetyl-1-D-myo-inositol-2-amino-2-deoxy-alpha-D-glucopyranoside deacetylase [Humibacillus xanthopallidus]|uniref:N-acetyl-1-D-myo-inositol-2-amino-2-deoxy-alpha-D-glucopyranoside deacetylase n=1 Tax=Humibacillus xanthopallidus TaxID=412689 RepID=A0A543PRR4_9MICO|nr:N-acetyl-1-D-myo-inositol-2-amino-2-deoxy-alpha-D-glucopyranoside deacetylase [Humibacillus xanthopallidus]TQN46760.1 N-acetyl-1-D-myo-inositol-2-amino-2-deoxy-alpha-D-glucopyranoside deacetylase [Humibacillus xanthopallidus]
MTDESEGAAPSSRAARLLLVHAHPDDESLTCGIAMAHHVARGDEVHVLTCTLGEEGEVIPPGLAHLEAAPDDALGPHRHGELAEALRRVGATMHVLGEGSGRLSRYRDSGMAGSAAAARPEAFTGADLDEAARLVVDVITQVRPDVVITYDEHGGYGHPDHIQAHRVTRRALELVPDEVLPARVHEILTPVSWAREDRAWLREADPAAYRSETWWREHARRRDPSGERPWPLVLLGDDDPYPPSVVDDELVTHVVVDDAARAVKNAALRAHVTQVLVVSDDVHALSNLVATRTTAREGFRRVDPRTWQPVPVAQRRHSLLD